MPVGILSSINDTLNIKDIVPMLAQCVDNRLLWVWNAFTYRVRFQEGRMKYWVYLAKLWQFNPVSSWWRADTFFHCTGAQEFPIKFLAGFYRFNVSIRYPDLVADSQIQWESFLVLECLLVALYRLKLAPTSLSNFDQFGGNFETVRAFPVA
jgi:hypothetical protein